ncbi:glycosyltransferase family 2 protein [Thermodesulfobacteriota bacterium]
MVIPDKISVIITSYNQKEYLTEAIESVLSQTLQPLEIIIVDDASSDGSRELIEAYRLKYPDVITTHYNSSNLGIPKTKNIGCKKAQGDLVTVLDGDDRFCPTKLEKEYKLLNSNSGLKIVFSNVNFIDHNGKFIDVWIKNKQDFIETPMDIFQNVFAFKEPYWLFRNELVIYNLLEKIGFYDERLPIYEDTDLRIRLTHKNKVAFCPEPLTEYRKHSSGVHHTPATFHYKIIKSIYKKNQWMLNDLSNKDRYSLIKNVHENFSQVSQRVIEVSLLNNNKRIAFCYLLEALRYGIKLINPILAIQVFLPKMLYKLLKNKIAKKFSWKIRES